MWRTEWSLQLRAPRGWFLFGLLVVADVAAALLLEAVAQSAIAPLHGFDLLAAHHRLLFRLLLPAVLLVESLHWNGRGFRDSTLHLGILANLRRRSLFTARLALLAARLAAAWVVLAALSLWLALSFDAAPYPLLDAALASRAQVARFLLATGHDLAVGMMWLGVSFAIVVALRGRRFEAAFVAWTLFALVQLFGGAAALAPLGANLDVVFVRIELGPTFSAVAAASYGAALLAGTAGVGAGRALFVRMNLHPRGSNG